MREKISKISEGSYISIGLLALILIGALRVESTSSKADANEREIERLKDERKDYNQNLSDIKERLAGIEGALGVKHASDK
jgi:uncharacterized membrane-anchored protein YhcB (DUF1043 family)